MATKVTLRQKPISGNRLSLYLDFYPAVQDVETGELTRRKFLNMFLFNESQYHEQTYLDKNGREQKRFVPVLDKDGRPRKANLDPLRKQHNKAKLLTAQQIRMNYENRFNKPEVYTEYELKQLRMKELGNKNFVEYFKSLADQRKASNYDNWISASKYLVAFTNGHVKFADLDEKFFDEFKNYLLTTKSNKGRDQVLSQNSAVSYFNKVKTALKQAFKDGFLQVNLNAKIASIKTLETHRNVLSIEELNALVTTHCKCSILKKAALFSALTGLRFSDIQKLTWGEVQLFADQGYSLHYKQQKTKGVEVMPISDQAFSLLGERRGVNCRVFEGLKYSAQQNKLLNNWIAEAGIAKKITFHCFRHTFATLLLSNGTDIYTVSKMLGHRELKTTQVYTKVIDLNKRTAANKISLNF